MQTLPLQIAAYLQISAAYMIEIRESSVHWELGIIGPQVAMRFSSLQVHKSFGIRWTHI